MAASSNGCFAHQQVGGPWPEEGKRWSPTHQCKYPSPTASEASPPPEYGTLTAASTVLQVWRRAG